MFIPSPLQQYHFHIILIWWHSPLKFSRAEYLKVSEERRLVEEQVTEQEGRLLQHLWPGHACGSGTWQLEQYRPGKARGGRRRCNCPAVQRSGEYQHRLRPAGSAEQVKGKEVLSGCIAIGYGWTLALNNTGPRWRCIGGEVVNRSSRGELLLGACQPSCLPCNPWGGGGGRWEQMLCQHGPSQPGHTAINGGGGGRQ